MAHTNNPAENSGSQVDDGESPKNKPTCAVSLRPAVESDLTAINDIYNYYVLHSTCTYQEEPEPLPGRRQWFHDHDPRHPIIVAEHENDVVGWGSLSPYHHRSAYRNTVENSVYVHPEWHQRGIGSALLQDLIRQAKMLDYHAIIAAIDADQTKSVRLHAKFNFEEVGHPKARRPQVRPSA